MNSEQPRTSTRPHGSEPTRPQGPEPIPAQRPTLPRGVVAALMAVMLAGGMVTGAVLGPASASPLLSNSEIVQRALALLAAQTGSGSPTSATPPPKPAESALAGTSSAGAGSAKPQAASKGGTSSSNASEPRASEKSAPESSGGGEKPAAGRPARLPPIQHVWLIVLDGTTFADATAAAHAYPYVVGQLVGEGVLLTNYSALDGYELAGDAALLPGGIGASVRPVSEPGCNDPPPTEGGSLPCAQGNQPSPAQVDAFAQRILAPILASPAYHENGFVAITFAPTSEEADTPTSTLALKPTAGVLLLSPLLHGDTRSSTAFQPLSPRTSLQMIFGH